MSVAQLESEIAALRNSQSVLKPELANAENRTNALSSQLDSAKVEANQAKVAANKATQQFEEAKNNGTDQFILDELEYKANKAEDLADSKRYAVNNLESDLDDAIRTENSLRNEISLNNVELNDKLDLIDYETAKENWPSDIENIPPNEIGSTSNEIIDDYDYGFSDEEPESPELDLLEEETGGLIDSILGDLFGNETAEPTKAIPPKINSEPVLPQTPKIKSETYIGDAVPKLNATGKLEDLIANHVQPRLKHDYIGAFPVKLSDLDWLIKSMDRPKIDIEYVEQIRNNVKRYYPIKYNYGDLSITFLDDVHHKTIDTIHQYFTGNIWKHESVQNTGCFLLRDSVTIPYFKIYDLTVENETHLEYTFENVLLSSYDFDANDTEDEGVHTIQAVFKIERYDVRPISDLELRTINAFNDPKWV